MKLWAKSAVHTWGEPLAGAARVQRSARRRLDRLPQQRLQARELELAALVQQRAQRVLQVLAAVAEQAPRYPGVR